MILLILATCLFAVVWYRGRHDYGLMPWAALGIGLAIFVLFSWEVSNTRLEFSKSDEILYFGIGDGDFPSVYERGIRERYVWAVTNWIVINWDVFAAGVPLKLVSLPLLGLLLLALYHIFDRRREIFWLPVLLPYFALVATYNLRDTLILALTAGVVLWGSNERRRDIWLMLGAAVMLFFTRPHGLYMIILAAVIVHILTIRLTRVRLTRRAAFRGVMGVLLVSAVAALIAPVAVQIYESDAAWLDHTRGEGAADHIEHAGDGMVQVGRPWVNFVVSSTRYIATPLPTSIAARLLSSDRYVSARDWGLVDDSVRIVHQGAYYILVLYLVFHWRFALSALGSMNRQQLVFVTAMLSYWPIYSFHLFGMTHQRLKLPFQLAVFILAIVVYVHRTKRSKRRIGVAARM